VFIPGPN